MDRPYPVMHGTVEKAKNEGAARSGADQPRRVLVTWFGPNQETRNLLVL